MPVVFSVEKVARMLNTTVESVQEQIGKGRARPVQGNGRTLLTERDTYKLGFALYMQNERHLLAADIDRILESFDPWSGCERFDICSTESQSTHI